MTKYLGKDYELRLATSEGGLASAPALSRWESINVKVGQGRQKSPVGLGSRLREVDVGLLDYSGSASGWYDETAAGGAADVLSAFGMFEQSDVTPLYLQLKNKKTSQTITLKKCTGDAAVAIKSPEAYVMWSWDFDFEDISKT
jgi:hypothetical protein